MPRSVFVVGAGSSIAVGGKYFPSGAILLEKIGAELKAPASGSSRSAVGQLILETSLSLLNNDFKRFAEAAQRIHSVAYAYGSIDRLITNLDSPDVTLIAKACIAYFVGRAEISLSRMTGTDAGAEAGKTWLYAYLKEYLARAKTLAEAMDMLAEAKFVVFNYDRVIEHIIAVFLRNRFELSDHAAIQAVSKLGIEHPYGSLGALSPSPRPTFAADAKEFESVFYHRVGELISGLKTFGESVDRDIPERIQKAIDECRNLIFVGFGFGEENLQLILPADNVGPTKKLYSTNFDINERRWGSIESAVLGRLTTSTDPRSQAGKVAIYGPGRIKTVAQCAELVDHFSLEW